MAGGMEVLLIKPDEKELLEGLSSNVVVVRNDKVLCTPRADEVLGGWARHMVLQAAQNLGWECREETSLSLDKDDEEQIQEVFLTSSIRIIVPVQRVVQIDSDGRRSILWEKPLPAQMLWREFYEEITNKRKGSQWFSYH